ncbi:unnamed protein product [Callosobruchus maculatus]|uniref:Uncharacterized protein n=1 Tax=Callosobruchus maculatus TaxID=64391 RepID=A0A653BMR5_CALMS|nr:unnamed protein product [Callosobruchus maculatus]
MHASGVLRWYLAVILWCFAVRGSYVAEGTTLRYHRNIGNDREAVPSARYHQAISSDKEVERATDSGTMHDRNNTQSKINTIGTTTPRSTTSNYYQDRSNSNEVVLGRNKTTRGIFRVQRDLTDDKRVPPVQEPTVLRSSTTSEYYKGQGERDPIEVKSAAKHTVRGWYLAESTTLRYHRDIGNDREAVPSARYHQAISSDKEVERATESGTMHLHDRNSTQLPKDNTIGTTIPRSTTSSYYQDRSNGKEVVPGRNNTTPAMFTVQRVSIDDRRVPPVREPTVLRSGTTSGYYKGKGERDVNGAKIEANNTKRQDVIKGTTFGYMSTDLLEGTTEHGERAIVDNRDAGGMLNITSQDLTVSGRKIKMPRPNSQTMQYLLVPGFLMAGILPWVMPKLQMVAMMLSMVNNMAFTSALFTLIRNFIFERESAQHVLYINNGYKKKNRHRNQYKEHQHHAPIYYEHQHPHGLDHHDHSASQVHHEYQDLQEHQEYHQHPPGLDHYDHASSQVQYEHLQEHPPIGWENQGVSKFSEKWRRSGSTI